VCTGLTGHNEVTRVIYDPELISYADLLKLHWESHDPTQGMGQGNDRGTNYRSGIYCNDETELIIARASRDAYQKALNDAGHRNGARITTEVIEAPPFYYAEEYHQQYLARPGARQYCSAQPTMIDLPAASGWMPAEIPETMHPKVSDTWWSENPPGCHLFTAAYAQRYRLRRLHMEEEEEARKKPVSKL
jgi:peptide-methionine (S)-S-oxide reductase